MRHTATRWHPSPRGMVATLELLVWHVLYRKSLKGRNAQIIGSNPRPRDLRFCAITGDILVPELVVILDVRGGTYRIQKSLHLAETQTNTGESLTVPWVPS